jgi:mono/diheme cytochrome c family protein
MSNPVPENTAQINQIEPEQSFEVRDVHAAIIREKDEPADGYEPVPFWLLTFICALSMFGGGYIMKYSGGFSPDVLDHTLVTYGPVQAGVKKAVDPAVLGQRLFTNCASCHGASGAGAAGVYPSLVGSKVVLGGGTRMAAIIINGAQGPWEAASGTYNNAMTPWGNQLNDEQIAAIMTYVRGAWGNNAPPVSAEAVAQVRSKYNLGRQLTFAELQAIEDLPLDPPATQ